MDYIEEHDVYIAAPNGVYFFPVRPGRGNALNAPEEEPPGGMWVVEADTPAYRIFNLLGAFGLWRIPPSQWEAVADAFSKIAEHGLKVCQVIWKPGLVDVNYTFGRDRKKYGLFRLEEVNE